MTVYDSTLYRAVRLGTIDKISVLNANPFQIQDRRLRSRGSVLRLLLQSVNSMSLPLFHDQGTVLTEQRQGTIPMLEQGRTLLRRHDVRLVTRFTLYREKLLPVLLRLQRLELRRIANAGSRCGSVAKCPRPVLQERAIQSEYTPILDQHQSHVALLRPMRVLGDDGCIVHNG